MPMVQTLMGVAIATALLLPPALKWELRLSWVVPWILAVGAVVGFAAGQLFPEVAGKPTGWIGQGAVILALSGLALAWRFFRDPDRRPPETANAVLSPADGVILYINAFEKGQIPGGRKAKGVYSLADFTKTNLFNNGGVVIGIGMSFLDVHVNRSPVTGRVEAVARIPGRFLSLKRPEALTLNERALIVLRVDGHPVGIVQIASRLVRRIVSYVQAGQTIKAGERIGMIKFGSQVDLILPAELQAEIRCRAGQQVYAGLTILAERTQSPERKSAWL